MTSRRKLTRSLLLSCSALIPALIAVQAHAQAVNLGGAGNLIIPDGRTQTEVSSSGNITDIHTDTVRGKVGFNSFSQFQVGSGNAVNLHLPTNTETLVNIVRDGPVVVEGTVNSIKSGAIGGNVVFSDAYGFVLGSQGIINTGSLTVNTPTREFLNGAVDGNGVIDTAITNRLISGDVPLSAGGAVILNGTVNAANNIAIQAGWISVGDAEALRRHRDVFGATVNTEGGGLVPAASLVVSGGRIELRAAGSTTIGSGSTISARGAGQNGAEISVSAGQDISIARGSSISARSSAGSALVRLTSGGQLALDGAVLALGDGQANAQVKMSGGSVQVGATGTVLAVGGTSAGGTGIAIASTANIAVDGRLAVNRSGVLDTNSTPLPPTDAALDLSSGAKIVLLAEQDIRLGGAGVIDASATANGLAGGDIYVIAQRDLSVASGSTLTSRGAGAGDGGFLELSGHQTLNLGAVRIDLRSSGSGLAGSLLIDPQDMIIADASSYVRGAVGSLIDNVSSVTLNADTITVAAGGWINTYKAGADALDVTLVARSIVVAHGGVISAGADAGFKRGNVVLAAIDKVNKSQLQATANASVEVNGYILGDAITLSAEARALTDSIDNLYEDAGVGVGSLVTGALLGRLTGLKGGLVAADSTARVTIGATAEINATGDVSLTAQGEQKASNQGLSTGSNHAIQLTAFFGEITGQTTAEIKSGAQITTTKSLSVKALNTAKLDVSALSFGLKDVPAAGALAIGLANIETKAVVQSGATLKVGGNLTVLADNTNSLSVSAVAAAMGDGDAGLALAVQVSEITATAHLGADVGTTAAKVGNVSVSAISDTLLNRNSAAMSVGDSKPAGAIRNVIPTTADLKALIDGIKKDSAVGAVVADGGLKGGLAFMYGQTTLSALASVGADITPTTTLGWAPSIVSSGNVSVLSSVYDAQLRSNANAIVEGNAKAGDAVAVAIAVGTYEHVSHATIGRNVSIDAQNLGVSAKSDVPLVLAYQTARTPKEIFKVIAGSLNGNLGIVNNILTSYAGSTVAAKDNGLAASINVFGISHDTEAWVSSGAKIITRAADTAQGWTAQLGSEAGEGTAQSRAFKSGVDVNALTHTDTINMAGVPAWLVFAGGNEIGNEGKSGGGSLNLNLFNTTTRAGIGAGVSITSPAGVTVDAKTLDTVVAISPSSGKGAAFGVNGMMSYLGLTNTTSASISNSAIIAAKSVAVTALQDTLVVAVSGAISQGTGSNVGISATWANLESATSAYIGDNSDEVRNSDRANLAGYVRGVLTTDSVTVEAHTGGANYAMSVAAAISAPESGESGIGDTISGGASAGAGNLSGRLAGTLTGSTSKMGKLLDFFASNTAIGLSKISSELEPPQPAPGQTRKSAIAGAGSISGVTTAFATTAYIDGPSIARLTNGGSVTIAVQATNDLLISTTSGAASLALAGFTSAQSSAAVSAAFAIAFTDNQTTAFMRNVTATNSGGIRVAALASGQQIVLGLGVAGNTNANKSKAIGGSISFGGSIDGVNARIENSTLDARPGANHDAEVLAYQNTDIGIGGLAVAVATNGGGFGLALTGTVLANPTGSYAASARILNSTLRNFRDLNVEAITVSRVLSGAGSVGITPNGLGINGAIVFNDISTSTIAEIRGDGTQTIQTAGNVSVKAGSERRADVETALSTIIQNKTIDAGFDFSDRVLNSGTTGALIMGVAGTVGFGQKNAGVAIQYGSIRHDHEAYLTGVTLVAAGDLTVSARDTSKIFGVAAGVSIGTGGFAGAGSLSINVIGNSTLAKVYGADTSVTARNISVTAYNASTTGGGAGAVSISLEGTGIGLSLINNTIANSTDALVEGASLTANGVGGNVVVGAQSNGELITYAVSVGIGSKVGVGGSVATSVALNNARAAVRGATINATNNVLISATNSDTIHAVAGGVGVSLKAAGFGLATVANIVRGETSAVVEDLGTTHSRINARASGAALTADSGDVANPYAYSDSDVTDAMEVALPDLSFSSTAINGIGVVATSRQNVGSFALAASASVNLDKIITVSASVAPVVNVLGGTTMARITNALINTDAATAGALADVAVIAASNTFTQNVVFSAAGATGLAVAGGFVSNIMERDTTAAVDGATIGGAVTNVGDMRVRATSTMGSLNVVAGLAVGLVGGAGSMAVNVLDAATLARLEGGSIAGRNVTVEAKSSTGILAGSGAGAGGAQAQAGAFNVAVNLGSTRALVGNGTSTTLVLSEDLRVKATSTDRQTSYVVGAAGAAISRGTAAMLNLSVTLSDTIASVNQLTASSMRDVAVTAENTTILRSVTGGLGFTLGGPGVGAGATVVLTKGTVAAEVVNSQFTARRALDVLAKGTRDIHAITFTAGAGSSLGLGAAVGIIVAGIDMSDDAKAELGWTLDVADAQASKSTNSQFVEAGTPGQRNTDGDKRSNVVSSAVTSTKRDSVTARIGNSTITAGASSVTADSKVETNNLTVGAGVGGVGVGAALGFTFVNQDVAATVTGSNLNVSQLAIKALSGAVDQDSALLVRSVAGAGGLSGAAGAAVAVAHVDSDVTATLTGTVTGGAGQISVVAEDRLTVDTQAVGAAVAGGVAIGLSLSVSSRNADITALIGPNSRISAANGVRVLAGSFGAARAESGAGAGGLVGAGVGASATALDETKVVAELGQGVVLASIGSGGVTVAAEATPELNARSIGVAVASTAAIGASIAVAKADLTVHALVGSNSAITSSGAFKVLADLKLGASPTLNSRAIAGSGALYLAANATVSEAILKGETLARVGDAVTLRLGNSDAEIKATSRTKQRSDVAGVALSLGLALGANVSEVSSETRTEASIGNNGTIVARNLIVEANALDDNYGSAIAGAGGIYAGSAAVVTTKTISNTLAVLGGAPNAGGVELSGQLAVRSAHETVLGGTVDSINAGLVGASGAVMLNTLDATVVARLADNAKVTATGFVLDADNITRKPWQGATTADAADWNISSGSGGLLNHPAGSSSSTIAHRTTAALGVDARVVLGKTPGSATADVRAHNRIDFFDKVKLDSGGAIALADARTYLTVSQNDATVEFGTGAALVVPNGNIRIAAYDDAAIDIRAAATTYGIAGAPSGMADIDYRRANLVRIGSNVVVEANSADNLSTGRLSVAAGADLNGTLSRISALATLDLYNNSALPISASPNPIVRVSGDSRLQLDGGSTVSGAGLRAAGNISLTASRGVIEARATGTGKDIYREALAAIASGISELFGGGAVSFDYKGGETRLSGLGVADINGVVLTGIDRNKSLTINYATVDAGGCLVATTICLALPVDGEIAYTVENNIPIGLTILDRIKELRQLMSDYGSDPVAKAAYQSEISFLEAKLTALGLVRDGTSGAFIAPSELDQKKALLELNTFAQTNLGQAFGVATASALTQTGAVLTTAESVQTSATALTQKSADATTSLAGIITDIQSLSGYGGGNAASNATDLTSLNGLTASNATLSTSITTARGTIAAAKLDVSSANTRIETQQALIVTKLAEIGTKPTTAQAEILALQQQIETARTSIATDMALVNEKLAVINTAVGNINTAGGQISANLASISTLQSAMIARSSTGNAGDLTKVTAINGKIATFDGLKQNVATASSAIGTNQVAVTAAGTALAAPLLAISGYAGKNTQFATEIATIRTGIANNAYSTVNANAPTTGAVTVADTVARLGDILVTADQLIGTGALRAPGNASIDVTNNTGHTLKLGNLTINSESGGRIRFNGAEVNSLGAINALNRGGAVASFADIVTAKTQGSPLPSISIRSNYTSDSATYYNPNSSVYALKTARPAPDVILMSGKVLSNPRGAVNILSQAGNIYMHGETEAGSVSITAKNGDFVQGFVYGFQHVAGDPAGTVPLGAGITANGAINLSARYLNINGTVQSGIAEWTLTIGQNPWLTASSGQLGLSQTTLNAVAAYVARYRNAEVTDRTYVIDAGKLQYVITADGQGGRYEFTANYADEKLSGGTFVLTQAGGNIGASYDVAAKQFVVDGTNVRGGSIQVFGQILNTSSTAGALNVLDGFGTINIINNDTRNVVLGKLDTGEDATGTGRGVAGRIEITDIYALTSDSARPVTAVRTLYTRENNLITSVRTSGYIDAGGTFVSEASLNSTKSGSAWTYDPQTGLRYNYTTAIDYSEKIVTQYSGTQFLGNSDWRAWEGKDHDWRVTTQLAAYRLKNGTYVSSNTAVGDLTKDYASGTPVVTLIDEWSSCNWWSLCISQDYTIILEAITPKKTITTHTLKADNPIAINFIGQSTGAISVKSTSSVLLTGAINNRSGSTILESSNGNIVQANATASINSNALILSAANGSVGALGTGNAIRVALGTGDLSAAAGNGNVVVDASSSINVGTITAAGQVSSLKGRVVLTAAGSIVGKATSLIQAPRVELTATNGAIGSTTSLLKVNTGFSANPADRPFGDPASGQVLNTYYGLKATAVGDIGITSTAWAGNSAATMLVDQVVSTGGNVRLATAGAILDNNPIQSVDTRTYNELLAYWNDLGLLAGADNTAKVNAVIKSFETQVATERQLYLQMRSRQSDGGAAYDGQFVYRMTAAEKLAFGETLRLADGTLTQTAIDGQIADFEQQQTARYHRMETQLASLTGTFNQATGAYTASADERAARAQGSEWSERQLAFSLSAGALKTITGTNPVTKAANVSGRVVTLEAGKGLGEVAGSVVLPTNILPSALTDAQKIALATAERGDFTYSNGVLTIQSIRPLNFDAADRLNAQLSGATANAYLAALGDARLGTVSVPGELRLKVLGSIIHADGLAPAISAGSLILEASNGGIGSYRDLNGNVIDGTLRVAAVNTSGAPGAYRGQMIARAGLGVSLKFEAVSGVVDSGDANIDTVYSRGDVKIVADKSVRNANTDGLINVLANSVQITALDGGVGSSANQLNIGNAIGGQVDLAATADIFVHGTGGYQLNLRTVVASGAADVTAAGDLILSGAITAPTAARFNVAGALTMTQGQIGAGAGGVQIRAGSLRMLTAAGMTSVGAIDIATRGDAQITNLISAGAGTQAIRIDAGGRILAGTAAGRTDLSTTTQGAGVTLVAASGIGSAWVANTTPVPSNEVPNLNHLRVASANVAATTTTGALAVHLLNDVASSRFVNTSGSAINLIADGNLTSAAILAGSGAISATVGGSLVADQLVSGRAMKIDSTLGLSARSAVAGGTMTLSSGGDLVFDYLKTLGIVGDVGDMSLTSRNGSILGGQANANGNLTINAKDRLAFTALRSGQNMDLAAGGDVSGSRLEVGGGLKFNFPGARRISFDEISGSTLNLVSGGTLHIDRLNVGQSVSFGATDLEVGVLNYTGQGRLALSIAGSQGGVANSAAMNIIAPAGTTVGVFHVADARIVSSGADFSIDDAYVPGSLRWQTPLRTVWMNNRNQTPVLGNDVQLYQPGFAFVLNQQGYLTSTNSFAVRYGDQTQMVMTHAGETYPGASFVRDFERALQHQLPRWEDLDNQTGRSIWGYWFNSRSDSKENEPRALKTTDRKPAVNLGE